MDEQREKEGVLELALVAVNMPGYHSLASASLAASVAADTAVADWLVKRLDFERSGDLYQPYDVLLRLAEAFALPSRGVVPHIPRLVGLSCTLWNVELQLHLARLIKRVAPKTRLVAGGPEAAARGAALLAQEPALDAVVVGDGEAPLRAILAAEKQGADWQRVPGLWVASDGTPRFTGAPADASTELDLPSSANALSAQEVSRAGRVLLETSRGCRYRCAYCYYHRDHQKLLLRPIGAVLDDLRQLAAKGARCVYIVDPCFNADPQRTRSLLQGIARARREEGLRLALQAEIRAELVNEEQALLYAKAGFESLSIGLQSSNEETRRAIGRFHNNEAFAQGIARLHNAGISYRIDTIAVLPGDDLERFYEAQAEVSTRGSSMLGTNPLKVLPGTELARQADADGLVFDPDPPYLALTHSTFSLADLVAAQHYHLGAMLSWVQPGLSAHLAAALGVEEVELLTRIGRSLREHLDSPLLATPWPGYASDVLRACKQICFSLLGDESSLPRDERSLLNDILDFLLAREFARHLEGGATTSAKESGLELGPDDILARSPHWMPRIFAHRHLERCCAPGRPLAIDEALAAPTAYALSSRGEIEISEQLYFVAQAINGLFSLEEIAAIVSTRYRCSHETAIDATIRMAEQLVRGGLAQGNARGAKVTK